MARLPTGLYRRGNTLWMHWSHDGKVYRESTKTASITEAQRILNVKRGAASRGEPILPRVDGVTYDDLRDNLVTYYETSGKRDLVEAGARLAHLDPFFRGRRAVDITPDLVTKYVKGRQEAHAANGTINRELGVLSKMFRLGARDGKVLRVPYVERLKEADPRAGFFEDDQFRAVSRHLPEDLRVAATVGYVLGWRTQSEILTRERRHIDLAAGVLRLEPGETKNGRGREVYLTQELRLLLGGQVERVEALQRRLGRIIPFLFPHLTNGRRYKAGDQRKDYRKAWQSACEAAGVPGMLKHDLRRTAVRGLVRSGVPEGVAMKITGHQTRSVFDRYAIVAPGDLRAAARKLDAAGACLAQSVAQSSEGVS